MENEKLTERDEILPVEKVERPDKLKKKEPLAHEFHKELNNY